MFNLKTDHLDPFLPVQYPHGSSRWLANPHRFAIWNCTVWPVYCPKKSDLSNPSKPVPRSRHA